jgi:SRSO17 transposase
MEGLAKAAGHADRIAPLKFYCTGLLLPGERKSVEPMAARLAPDRVGQMHQSLHHLVADAPWDDEAVMRQVRAYGLAAMKQQGPIQAWIIDDTSFPKKGKHSVGVVRQYCGQLGKQENCRVAVSLSVANTTCSLPIAWRLYLPEVWAEDAQRRKKTGIPEEVRFQTKPVIAVKQIQQALAEGVPPAPILADAAYGNDSQFREGITELGLNYVLGVQSSTTAWKPGEGPLPKKEWKGMGRPPRRLQRNPKHSPESVKQVAVSLPATVWKSVMWRQGTNRKLRSRFAALRVRPAHRDYWRAQPHPEEWLLIEWPKTDQEPTKYWFSTLPPETKLADLVRIAKHRWIIERDYEELKQELGLGHFEGRGWRGFHHHGTLCIAAYGFLVSERNRFSPSARVGHVGLPRIPVLPEQFRPRGSTRPSRTA